MEELLLILGILLGYTIRYIIERRAVITGIIKVDHQSEQCMIKIIGDELSNPHCKRVSFLVDHNAVIRVKKSDYNE